MRPEADSELVQRLVRGERAALGALYDRFAPNLTALAQCILGGATDAEQVVQETLLEAWHRARYYDASWGSLHCWLALRVRARALQRLRSSEIANASERDPTAWAHAPSRAPCSTVVEQLSQEQRAVVELAYFGGCSSEEISLRLGLPIATVKSRLASATQRLLQLRREQEEGGQP